MRFKRIGKRAALEMAAPPAGDGGLIREGRGGAGERGCRRCGGSIDAAACLDNIGDFVLFSIVI